MSRIRNPRTPTSYPFHPVILSNFFQFFPGAGPLPNRQDDPFLN